MNIAIYDIINLLNLFFTLIYFQSLTIDNLLPCKFGVIVHGGTWSVLMGSHITHQTVLINPETVAFVIK